MQVVPGTAFQVSTGQKGKEAGNVSHVIVGMPPRAGFLFLFNDVAFHERYLETTARITLP